MSKVKSKHKTSVPSGTDQVTVVREAWAAYQGQEKRFSKPLALALIALHKQFAKPGYGEFREQLKTLDIPKSTAYRLMELHGWKADKKITRTKEYTLEEHRAERYKVFRNEVRAFCKKVGTEPAKLQAFFQEVTEGLGVVVEVREA